MANVNPAPAQLGLASPALGAWFDNANIQLAVPGVRLSVPLTFPSTGPTAWWPPAIGTLTLAVGTPTRPRTLAGLTDALGAPAFGGSSGSTPTLVALYKLLPEVEDRLEAISAILPRPDGGALTGPSRARVRSIAIEYPDAATSRLTDFVNPLGGDAATAFGLIDTAGTLANGPLPMSDLKKPGQSVTQPRQVMANFPASLAVTLWAFDADGHALDPGAVAAWWTALANGNVAPFNGNASNLWAEAGNNARTCAVAPHLGFKLVNPHRGPVGSSVAGAPPLPTNNAPAVGDGSANLFTAAQATGATLSFAAPAAADALPPMAAVLPIGNYLAPTAGTPLRLWQNGGVRLNNHNNNPFTVTRDYVEVAVVDVESFVCGTLRGPADANGTAAERRAADQARASTRINVRRSTVALLPTIDAVAGA